MATLQEHPLAKAQEQLDAVQRREQDLTVRAEAASLLAKNFLELAKSVQTKREKREAKLLGRLIQDPKSKAFITQMFDSCFRTENASRAIDQILFLIDSYGIPSFAKGIHRALFLLLQRFGKLLPKLSFFLIKKSIYKQVMGVIAPGERHALTRTLRSWKKQNVRVNLNRLGEAILGESEAKRRLELYLDDLANPEIEVISVKLSSINSHINLQAWDDTLTRLKNSLRLLYRQALLYNKFVNLDMEEYKDLYLTVQLFQELLDEKEFLPLRAGIALQSYIPESAQVLERLTKWALDRKAKGGAPIKIRLVKGANLGWERVEASIRGWPLATYLTKQQTDANFIKMLESSLQKEACQAVEVGVASHNLFDVAYACILACERGVRDQVAIEMLAGMAPHLARAVNMVWGNLLLYLPAARREEFHTSIAYLMRRLDENTAPENFLTHLFTLEAENEAFLEQQAAFVRSLNESQTVCIQSRRWQNRNLVQSTPKQEAHFENEVDTDFTQEPNRLWASRIRKEWQVHYHEIPLMIAGHELVSKEIAQGIDPSRPTCRIHTYFLADETQVDKALERAKERAGSWAQVGLSMRCELVKKVARELQSDRERFIGAMLQEAGKIVSEADSEVSEAIDFVNYYTREALAILEAEKLFSQAKVSLVITPWNFPISIPCSALASSLISGHSVIFKPAPEAVLSGWLLAQAFWRAGIPQDVLQFVTCADEPVGTKLVTDPRVDTVLFTGSTATAKKFLDLRPTLKLFGETGGKNSLIVTAMADRDLAIKDALHSAFSYAGQKCSACSLLIVEEEVYRNKSFQEQLVDGTKRLIVGRSYDATTDVSPLIRPPSPHLLRAMTTLEAGESWLVKPKQDPKNPHLWSPGIKYGVQSGSFTHQTELFGPLLGVMCAKNLEDAIALANATPYGLTAGIHTLDPREKNLWRQSIQAGNCYINRAITGAIVARQPFGGTKASSFGLGMKVGGPNYLLQLGNTKTAKAFGHTSVKGELLALEMALQTLEAKAYDIARFHKASASMTFWWENYFTKPRILKKLIGQDNILEFRPHKEIYLLFQDEDPLIDLFLIMAAAMICGCRLISGISFRNERRLFRQGPLKPIFQEHNWIVTEPNELVSLIQNSDRVHLRAIHRPHPELLEPIKAHLSCLDIGAPSVNGRLELIHYVREVAISEDYHRYGNLMDREQEAREAVT